MRHPLSRWIPAASILLLVAATAQAQQGMVFAKPDSSSHTGTGHPSITDQAPPLNCWGVDILISTDGFGLGTFYRREFTPDLYGFASFSISEAKDEREFEQFDPYTQISYVPGKLNRFLVLPLMLGVQYRLFREDIMDSFRPYVNGAAGPAMVYMMPFAQFSPNAAGGYDVTQVDFFKSLGRGTPHYTASAFLGFGANFGSDKTSVFGVNFRYYFTYLFGGGLPSLYRINNTSSKPEVSSNKTSFGGFFITLNLGMGY